MLKLGLAGITIGLFVGPACLGEPPEKPRARAGAICLLAFDHLYCEPDLWCTYGRCRTGCSSDRDCAGSSCVASPNSEGDQPIYDWDLRVCLFAEETSCTDDPDCPESLYCDPHGTCRPGCNSINPCREPFACLDEVCTTGDKSGAEPALPPLPPLETGSET